MTTSRNLAVWVALAGISALTPSAAGAQDLFELEVFRYETTAPGEYDVAFHTNVISRGGVTPDSAAGNHRPLHVSVEATRGWTDRFETAVFIQTAPFGSSGSARFAGGHLRAKVRIGEVPSVPLRIAASAEYTFNHAAFDGELQTLEVRPILEYQRGRLALAANPSLEIVMRGSDEGLAPVFDVSAAATWRLLQRMTLTSDYFSAAATTRHLQSELGAHHLIFAGAEFQLSPAWTLSISAGHCLTRQEPWLMKSIVGVGF